MKNFVYIATSLDGYIADSNGGVDWLHTIPNPKKLDFGYAEFMEQIDALLMGRNTFETVCGFDGPWPYQKQVFVLSNSLTALPSAYQDKVNLVTGPIKEVVSQLNSEGFQNLYIDGGITVQGFLKQDMIDEMIITRLPVILGDGIPLFTKQEQALWFEHVKTEVLIGELVQSHYRRKP